MSNTNGRTPDRDRTTNINNSNGGGGGSGWLIAGILIVVVIVGGYFLLNGNYFGGADATNEAVTSEPAAIDTTPGTATSKLPRYTKP